MFGWSRNVQEIAQRALSAQDAVDFARRIERAKVDDPDGDLARMARIYLAADDQIEHMRDEIARLRKQPTPAMIAEAIYNVANKWLAPNFPPGWKPVPLAEAPERDRRLHAEYALAVLDLFNNQQSTAEK